MFSFGKKRDKKKEKQKNKVALHTKHSVLESIWSLPIKKDWLTSQEEEKILRDPTVISAIGSRKAATLKKEITLECENSEIKKELENCFNFETLSTMLDVPYQGFGVWEINWINNNIYYPTLIERDYKNFTFQGDELRFSGDGLEKEIPKAKAIYATYNKKFNNPYGKSTLYSLFWLIKFKNASLEFWIEFLEKFGTPWIVGKTDSDKETLADEIYAMLGGDGAVLDTEDSLEIKTPNNKGDFKELIEYIDNQIRQTILGGNLTSDVKSGGSYAAANVHNNVREDLAAADKNIVLSLFNQTIKYFIELNALGIEINISLKDKDDPNIELAKRDKTITQTGFLLSTDYIEATYNVKVTKKETTSLKSNNISTTLFSNKKDFYNDVLDEEIEKNSDDHEELILQFEKIVNSCSNYEEVLEKIIQEYPKVDTQKLEKNLKKQMINSKILAATEVENEH
jgi:phage gp29-like protein